MERDYGIRFSEEKYLTKDEVKQEMGLTSVDSIWEQVLTFRYFYRRQTSLMSFSNHPFTYALVLKNINRITTFEKKFNILNTRYLLSKGYSKEYVSKQYFGVIKTIAQMNRIKVSDELIKNIVDEVSISLPLEYQILDRYYRALKYIENKNKGDINENFILTLYTMLRGIKFDINSAPYYYRKDEKTDSSTIQAMLMNLLDFINNDEVFTTFKAVASFFYIRYLKPFPYFNDEIAFLLLKYVLLHDDLELLPNLMNIEKDLINDETKDKYEFLKSANSLDLTYYFNYGFDFLRVELTRLFEEYNEVEMKMVEEEQAENNLEEEVSTVEIKKDVPSQDFNFETKVSLPNIPLGLNEDDASLIRDHLIELYPTIKKNQADFYSRHCTIGKYYTIAQYKKEENVVYETARTSMDNLVALGLYKKEEIRHKFFYTPVSKND